MAQSFKVDLDQVTWKMLSTVKHRPIVILRPKTQKKN
jgi:F420-0:gamma-glutamyl ligase-like protein